MRLTWSTMDEREVYQGDIFLIARDNIVAILLQRHSSKHLIFCTAISHQSEIAHRIVGLCVHLLPGECLVLSELLISHVRRSPRTLDYVIFLFAEGAFRLIHIIRHGDTLEALEKTSAKRR
jgi:hypothetical protein